MHEVLVYDFVPVSVPFEHTAQWVHDGPGSPLAAAGAAAFQCPEEIGHVAHRPVRARLDSLVVDLHWVGDLAPARFEHFDGELQLAPLSGERSHISLSATYEPVGGAVLTSAERIQTHRETEARVRHFLTAVAMLLEQAARERR